MRPKTGLVLGSGGLRGLAHVGVLKVLERENIPIDYIAGCSIGALIGALYCSGHSPETILKLAKHLKRRHWLDFVVPKMGLFSGDKVLETTRLLTQQKTFSDLNIPLAIVATEINQGQEVVFNQGDLAKAVRASVSVPGVFVPYQWDDMLLVDGAVVNPTPIDVVRNMGADIVIAVDLAHAGTVFKLTNMFDVIIQSIDIMERQLFKHRQHHCSVLIRPEISHIPPSAFEAVEECAELGEKAAAAAVAEIKQLLAEGC
ncbi:patatin-like phospholipase family protein|uniref:NTE family protein n=1 Tax=Dendrosporobacter quercicolus TaxID=146817 RepID=A0A1G9L784_9FIRM|nr:patatin-like phospholipase family protein [Dendrosporobacter quercicolus]NSL46625.1 patatin-like phospholipase family protein [Dendrosporobacter quercicolus DSM 1736]SDL57838.1 NTE family protein [Dendrosporobacter quercicolus]